MNKYFACVTLDNSFALENMNEFGSFWNDILDAIPKVFKASKSSYRFNFATFILLGENRKLCKETLIAASNRVLPGNNKISNIIVFEYDEKNKMSTLMETIMNSYYGAEEYKNLIVNTYDTINILKQKQANKVIFNTNYAFVVDHGNGFTSLLSSFANFLNQMGIYDISENRTDYLEVEISNKTENGKGCVDDFISLLKDNLKDNIYSAVGVDISYFLEKSKYDELRDFLKRLEKYQNEFIFVFRIPYLEKKALDEILMILSDIMIIKTIKIPPLSDSVLLEKFWDIVGNNNFEVDESIFDIMTEKINEEKSDGRFYGFKTINKLSGEVILKKAEQITKCKSLGLKCNNEVISASDLEGFTNESLIVKKGYEALGEMIGMEKILERIKEIISQVKVSMKNEKLDRPCIHMRFTGSPGTGKTTVARIIGQIMKEEGILKKGAFIEYSGRDLCAEYIGQTAVKTSSICRDSYGSVLFIDEAYSLYGTDTSTNDYGKEAITTLVSEMENHRDDMLVVMAGYTDEMETLMKSNPGLRSRMPYVLEFPNYTKEQLFEIFMLMVKKHFEYDENLQIEAKKYFDSLSNKTLESKEFANARFVRNLYERTWSKAALRTSLDGNDNVILTKEDFIAASLEKEFNEKIDTKKTIGF